MNLWFYAWGSAGAGRLFFKPGFCKGELTMRDEVWLCDANLSLSWHPLWLCSALTSFPSPLTSCFARHLVSFHTVTSPLFPQHMSRTPPLSPSTQPSISPSVHWRRNTRNYQHSSISNSPPSHLCLSDIAPISHFPSSPPPPLIPLHTFPLNKFVPSFLLTGSSACGLSSSGVFRDMIWTSNSNFH